MAILPDQKEAARAAGKSGAVIGCCISCVNCLRKNAPKAAGFFLLQLLFYAHVVRRPPSSPIWARVRDRLQRSTAASFAGVRWWRLDEPRGAAAVLARNPPKFYVYEDNPYLNWLHPSCDMDGNALLEIPGKSTATFSPLGKTRRPLNSLEIGELPPGVSENQHLGDVALAQLALEKGHPWRTENPEEADLFLVLPLLNVLAEAGKARKWKQTTLYLDPICCGGGSGPHAQEFPRLCDAALVRGMNRELGRSPFFRRSAGNDHLLVNSHWNSWGLLYWGVLGEHMFKAHWVVMEGRSTATVPQPVVRVTRLPPATAAAAAAVAGTAAPPEAGVQQVDDFGEPVLADLPRGAGRGDYRLRLTDADTVIPCGSGGRLPLLRGWREETAVPASPLAGAVARAFEEQGPRFLGFNMLGKVDMLHQNLGGTTGGPKSYASRKVLCEAVNRLPPFVRHGSICASTSPLGKSSFPRQCEGRPDAWPTFGSAAAAVGAGAHFELYGPKEGALHQLAQTRGSLPFAEVECTLRADRRKYCDALTKTEFTLYAWGDTWTSSRLVNALDIDSLVVFTHRQQLSDAMLVMAHRVPWRELVIAPAALPRPLIMNDVAGVAKALADEVLSLSAAARAAKRAAVARYAPFVSWTHRRSKLFETLLSDVYLRASLNFTKAELMGVLPEIELPVERRAREAAAEREA